MSRDKESKSSSLLEVMQEIRERLPADPRGRPTVITPEIILKLEEAFALGCTDIEACLYAGISKSPFYAYQDANPDFKERKESLKENPVLVARLSVLRSMGIDGKLAMDFLKNKKSDEFNTKEKTELSGDITLAAVYKKVISQKDE